jgi:hypothetical protein
MEDKVLAVYVDDVLKQQYFLTDDKVTGVDVEMLKAIVSVGFTMEKMKFRHISIWLKAEKGGNSEKEK